MKNRYDIKSEDNLLFKAITYFSENCYDEIYLREFSRKLNISPNTSQRFLDYFLREGLIIEVRRGKMRYFKSNIDSLVFRHTKILISLLELTKCGLIDRLKLANVSHAIIFGSVAEGKNSIKSDLDLVVISANKNNTIAIIKSIEQKIGKEINSHVYSWNEWKKVSSENKAFYFDVLLKGINIIGEKPLIN